LQAVTAIARPFDGKCKACEYSAQRKSDGVRKGPEMQAHPGDQDVVVARRSNIHIAAEVDLELICIGFGAQARYFISLVAFARRNNNDKNRQWGRHSLPT
jgi:hypothetical protein